MATILGADTSEICPQINISSALTKILYSLPKPASKNVILLSAQDFPTIGFVFEQAQRMGYQLRFVENAPQKIENWVAVIDDDVAVVHATHALSNTSHLLPIKQICTLAKTYGAVSIIDVAQSTGIVPTDVKAWGCDFAIGTGVKFLCFGPGACFLYASKARLKDCEPIDVGWFSHENPFEMDIHHFKYAQDALRFFGGTPSPAPFIMANSALSLWEDIGFQAVHVTLQSHLDRVVEHIPEDLLISPRAATQRGGTVVINPQDRTRLRKSFVQHDIFYDERKEGFRCSVHGYTSEEDIERLITLLKAAL